MEYNLNEFVKYYEEMGINHHLTMGYTPEQNGVLERKNRIMVEIVRCMLTKKCLPHKFQAKAIYTIVYLLNRWPTRAIKSITPMEASSGVLAKHLKIFGSICYIHVPSIKKNKAR